MLRNIKELRRRAGISQQQLADVIGVTQQSINKYENHNIEPDITTLTAIADFFGTSVDYIIGRQDDLDSDSVITLSREEREFLSEYRKLDPIEKKCINTLIRVYSENNE